MEQIQHVLLVLRWRGHKTLAVKKESGPSEMNDLRLLQRGKKAISQNDSEERSDDGWITIMLTSQL